MLRNTEPTGSTTETDATVTGEASSSSTEQDSEYKAQRTSKHSSEMDNSDDEFLATFRSDHLAVSLLRISRFVYTVKIGY